MGGSSVGRFSNGNEAYSSERGITVYAGHSTNVIAKVGLMYPSDYIYTYALGVNNTCYESYFPECDPNNGWLYKNEKEFNEWVITPDSSYHYHAFHQSGGIIHNSNSPIWNYDDLNGYVSLPSNIRPTVYLRSDIKITGGDGSSDNPYKLKAVE